MLINKIKEIRLALEAGLYNCALTVSLTLPDICGKVEFPKMRNGEIYKAWFRNYVEPLFINSGLVLPSNEITQYTWINAEECYALRCAFLHAGNYDTKGVDLSNVWLHAHIRNSSNYSHMIRSSSYADWDVILLCEKLCIAAKNYYDNSDNKDLFNLDEVRVDTW